MIVDDGSADSTEEVVSPYLEDGRLRYYRLEENQGLGAAMYEATQRARGKLIAYLPCDDVYHEGHLESLAAALDRAPSAFLAYSGVRHHCNRIAAGQIDGYPLQRGLKVAQL